MPIYRNSHLVFPVAYRRSQSLPVLTTGALLLLVALPAIPTPVQAQEIDEIIVYGDLQGIRNRGRAHQRDGAG